MLARSAARLHAKGTATPARTCSTRVGEFETGVVQKFDVINLGAVHIKKARFIHEYFQAIKFKNGIGLVAMGRVKTHAILEAGTAPAHHLNCATQTDRIVDRGADALGCIRQETEHVEGFRRDAVIPAIADDLNLVLFGDTAAWWLTLNDNRPATIPCHGE